MTFCDQIKERAFSLTLFHVNEDDFEHIYRSFTHTSNAKTFLFLFQFPEQLICIAISLCHY